MTSAAVTRAGHAAIGDDRRRRRSDRLRHMGLGEPAIMAPRPAPAGAAGLALWRYRSDVKAIRAGADRLRRRRLRDLRLSCATTRSASGNCRGHGATCRISTPRARSIAYAVYLVGYARRAAQPLSRLAHHRSLGPHRDSVPVQSRHDARRRLAHAGTRRAAEPRRSPRVSGPGVRRPHRDHLLLRRSDAVRLFDDRHGAGRQTQQAACADVRRRGARRADAADRQFRASRKLCRCWRLSSARSSPRSRRRGSGRSSIS